MKITEALKNHHDEMRKIMKQLPEDKDKYLVLKRHLDVHHRLEEDLLLQELHTNEDVKDESLESQEEHFVLNMLLLDLADFPKDHYRWEVKYKVLQEIINHHLDEEEDDLFPEAEKNLPEKMQEEMGNKFNELKEIQLGFLKQS